MLFLGCAFAQLVQPAQFVAYIINTDGTKALSQTQKVVFREAQIRKMHFFGDFKIGSVTQFVIIF